MSLLTSSAASKPANCVNIWGNGLRHTLAKTLRRPRCGIPIITDSTPSSVETSITSFMAGINISPPSRPKRFSDEYFLAKKASNLYLIKFYLHSNIQCLSNEITLHICNTHPVARVSRARIRRFCSGEKFITPGVSKRFLIQLHCSNELINMYSTPTLLQYTFSKRLRISLNN